MGGDQKKKDAILDGACVSLSSSSSSFSLLYNIHIVFSCTIYRCNILLHNIIHREWWDLGKASSSTYCRCIQVSVSELTNTLSHSPPPPPPLPRVVSEQFQQFATKKKLKHAGDPDVWPPPPLPPSAFSFTFHSLNSCCLSLSLSVNADIHQRPGSSYQTSPTISEGIEWCE